MEALIERIDYYVREYGVFNPLEMDTPYRVQLYKGNIVQIDEGRFIFEDADKNYYYYTYGVLNTNELLEVLYACMLRAREIEEMISYFESKFTEDDFAHLVRA